MTRKSILTWSDAIFLHKKMAEAQQELIEYAAHGCKETGLHDDLHSVVALISLEQTLGRILSKLPDRKKVQDDV